MKTCKHCGQSKPLSEFRQRSKGKQHARCKLCYRAYENDRWKIRSDGDKVRRRENVRKRHAGLKRAVDKLKADAGCADCDERDPVVLTFDHLDASLKEYNIADMVKGRTSLECIMVEIEKCEVVCSNCHMRREHKRREQKRKLIRDEGR